MDSTLKKSIIVCKVGIGLVKCLNSKHRQTVSSETTGDIIDTENVKKQEALFSFEMHWSSIASKNTRTLVPLVMIWNKFNFSLITA